MQLYVRLRMLPIWNGVAFRGCIMFKILGAVSILALASGISFSTPALAEVTYTFTSSEGDFTYISATFFDYGILSLGDLASYSFPPADNITEIDFHYASYSDIQLVNPICGGDADNCFDPTFGVGNIFRTPGTYVDLDHSGAQLVISGSPVPETATWAMMAIGFVGLGFIGWRSRKMTSADAA
jgi:hypothetical protein